MLLIQIHGENFVAGVVLDGGKVVRAAPILKYMLGWSEGRVISYAAYKGWKWHRSSNKPVRWSIVGC